MIYIIFFPQLISGPITRADGFFPQIKTKYLKDVDWVTSARWLIMGYFMKSFCANNLNNFTCYLDSAEGVKSLAGLDRIFLIFVYSIQIYADFYGYSAIALGLALLFGYRLPINFNLPYIADSFHEFWNRWHISLSRWLRIYLYFPLGGNRKGSVRTYFNLMTVMVLGGLWHGAGFNYLLWGAFHGMLLCIERPFLQLKERQKDLLNTKLLVVINLSCAIAVFGLVSIGWLLFKFSTITQMAQFVRGIIDNPWAAFHSQYFYVLAVIYSLPVIVQHLCANCRRQSWFLTIEPAFYAFLIFLTVVEAGPESTFIYFQF
jgi:alginate O-acetyltransferase complex protein AlgI